MKHKDIVRSDTHNDNDHRDMQTRKVIYLEYDLVYKERNRNAHKYI